MCLRLPRSLYQSRSSTPMGSPLARPGLGLCLGVQHPYTPTRGHKAPHPSGRVRHVRDWSPTPKQRQYTAGELKVNCGNGWAWLAKRRDFGRRPAA